MMKEIKVRITLTEEMLGTCSADPEIHKTYIASKAPDAAKLEEEVESLGVDEVAKKAMTVYPRFENGIPFIWNYQLKGFFKDTCSALQRCKGSEVSKESVKLKAFKKIIDGCIFVEPRKIPINMNGGSIGICERPLRASTPMGERISLASSETVPTGSSIEVTIILLSDDYEPAVREWLDYGRFKGLLQWRNSGKGTFVWEELR